MLSERFFCPNTLSHGGGDGAVRVPCEADKEITKKINKETHQGRRVHCGGKSHECSHCENTSLFATALKTHTNPVYRNPT